MSARYRFVALSALFVLAFVACPGDQTTPTTDDGGQTQSESEPTPEDGGEDDASSDDAASNEPAVTVESFGSCHERQTAGGNSDGELTLSVDLEQVDVEEGDVVAVELTSDAREEPISATGVVGADGSVVVVIPLTNIGEQLMVTRITAGDTEVDLETQVEGDLEFVVEAESTCLEE